MVNRYRVVLSLCFFLASQTSAAFNIQQAVKSQGWEALALLDNLSKSERLSVINQQNQFGETLLFKAAAKGLCNVVTFLIDRGAEIDVSNQSGLTPLSNAASVGQLDVVKKLLEAGASVTSVTCQRATPLHHAAASGSPNTVMVLIKAGAYVNAVDVAGCTPLFYAVQENDAESTQFLVHAGARVNIRDLQGETALHYAAKNGHFEIAWYLLRHKADPNIKNNFGDYPIHVALDSGHWRVIKLFVDMGVSKEVMKDQGLLHRAARNCSEAVVKYLIQNGWYADTVDENGNSPLHEAAAFNNESVVRYLIGCGLDVDQPNKFGWTPLLLAVKERNPEVVLFLLKYAGAKTDAESIDKDTVLGTAANQEDFQMMDELFKFGVSIDDTTLEELEEQESYGLYLYKDIIKNHWEALQKSLSALNLPQALAHLIGEHVCVSPAQVKRRLTRTRVGGSQAWQDVENECSEPAPKKAMIKPPDHYRK